LQPIQRSITLFAVTDHQPRTTVQRTAAVTPKASAATLAKAQDIIQRYQKMLHLLAKSPEA
jgi:hypothetical protein